MLNLKVVCIECESSFELDAEKLDTDSVICANCGHLVLLGNRRSFRKGFFVKAPRENRTRTCRWPNRW